MQIKKNFHQLLLDGEMELKCPHGRIDFSASSQDRRVLVNISNNKTFRYLLGTLPDSGISSLRGQLEYIAELPQAVRVQVGDKTILEKEEGAKPDVKFAYSALQWIRQKLGG